MRGSGIKEGADRKEREEEQQRSSITGPMKEIQQLEILRKELKIVLLVVSQS